MTGFSLSNNENPTGAWVMVTQPTGRQEPLRPDRITNPLFSKEFKGFQNQRQPGILDK